MLHRHVSGLGLRLINAVILPRSKYNKITTKKLTKYITIASNDTEILVIFWGTKP